MTRVRGRRGKHVHVSHDLRIALCGIKVDGFIIIVDEHETCSRCIAVLEDIQNGN
jgi:hypothetical protein